MSHKFSLHPISYFSGNCSNTESDERGNFNCHQKYIMDINNNVIRRCHNNRNLAGTVTGCKNSGFLHKTIKYTFREVKNVTIKKEDLTFNHLQLNEQEKNKHISPFSAPYNGKFSSVIVINKNEQLPHRYI